jgi:chemotaxis protein MotB
MIYTSERRIVNNMNIIQAAFIAATATVLLAGCVSTQKYDASVHELNSLRSEKQDLEDRLSDTRELLSREQAAKASLEGDRAQLQKEMADIMSVRNALFESNNELNDTVAGLSREKLQVMRERDQAVAELKDRVAQLAREKSEAVEEKNRAIAQLTRTYDSLVTELNEEIKKGEIAITQLKDRLTLSMVDKILFDSGKADIKPNGKAVLDRVAEILKNVTDKQIRIEGHTDNVPIGPVLAEKFPTNWELSTARSTTVVRYLQEQGIDPAYLSAAGYSEYRPVAPNETDEGKARNRRIEIVLTPLEAAGITVTR